MYKSDNRCMKNPFAVANQKKKALYSYDWFLRSFSARTSKGLFKVVWMFSGRRDNFPFVALSLHAVFLSARFVYFFSVRAFSCWLSRRARPIRLEKKRK